MRGLSKFLLLFLLACQDQNVLGSKIINGTTADDKLMNYMVSVEEDGKHICGGFLVSKHFVVTHGGCEFDEDREVFVVLGTHDLSKPGSKIKEQIKSTCKPPPGIGTDIMLIEIYRTKPEDLQKEIELQDPETDVKENEKCQLAGWGPVQNDGSDHVDQLNVVNVTVISPKACKDQIPGLRVNAICTGGKQTTDNGGFCKSDAGGPLVCKGKAVGIATVDDKCSFPGLPNVYIDISKYRSWIDDVLNGKIINRKIFDANLMEYKSIRDGLGLKISSGLSTGPPRYRRPTSVPQVNTAGKLSTGGGGVRVASDLSDRPTSIPQVNTASKLSTGGVGVRGASDLSDRPTSIPQVNTAGKLSTGGGAFTLIRPAHISTGPSGFIPNIPMASPNGKATRADTDTSPPLVSVQEDDGHKKTVDDKLMNYMVSVQEDDEHICGGFLVSKHFVVTHGGCEFDEDGKVMVVLGTHDLSKPGNRIKEHIKSTCKPPPGIGTDIMLIEINSRNRENLPEEIQLQDPETDVKENEKCQVAGWGPVDNNDNGPVDQLHVVNVTVISPKACKVQIPGLRANAICTGGQPTTDNGGFCKSDAGGPLVCKGKAVGIATVNDNCSFPGLPNVSIDISKYRSWIDKVLKRRNVCKM